MTEQLQPFIYNRVHKLNRPPAEGRWRAGGPPVEGRRRADGPPVEGRGPPVEGRRAPGGGPTGPRRAPAVGSGTHPWCGLEIQVDLPTVLTGWESEVTV